MVTSEKFGLHTFQSRLHSLFYDQSKQFSHGKTYCKKYVMTKGYQQYAHKSQKIQLYVKSQH